MIATAPTTSITISPPMPAGRSLIYPDRDIEYVPAVKSRSSEFFLPESLPYRQRFQPIVVMFYGRRGQGKTLGMTSSALCMKKRYAQQRDPFKVAANYEVAFAEYKDPRLVDELIKFPEEAKNMIVLIDEAGASFHNRKSMRGASVDFSTFLQQIRKRSIEVCFTVQYPQIVDYNVLLQVDLFIECEKEHEARSVHFYIHDWWGNWTGKRWRKPWPPMPGSHDFERTLHNTNRVWGQYNSWEVVAPMWSKERDNIIARQWEKDVPQEAVESPAPMVLIEPRTFQELRTFISVSITIYIKVLLTRMSRAM